VARHPQHRSSATRLTEQINDIDILLDGGVADTNCPP
jgi:hypothetical protein